MNHRRAVSRFWIEQGANGIKLAGAIVGLIIASQLAIIGYAYTSNRL